MLARVRRRACGWCPDERGCWFGPPNVGDRASLVVKPAYLGTRATSTWSRCATRRWWAQYLCWTLEGTEALLACPTLGHPVAHLAVRALQLWRR